MPSPNENKRNEFALTFNRLMAQHGKSVRNDSDAYFSKSLGNLDQVIKASQTRSKPNTYTRPGGSSSSTPTITPEQQAEYLAARGKEMKEEKKDKPWYKDALGIGTDVLSALDVPGAYARSALKEGMDTFETSGVGKWTYDQLGYDAEEDGRTLSKGSWKDFTSQAKRHMGFGEIWADARGDDKNKWLDRGAGLAGDIAFDPLTYTGAGVVTKTAGKTAAETAGRFGAQAGKEAAEATGKKAVQITGKNAVHNVADTVKGADSVFNKAAAERAALYKYTRAHPRRVVSKGLKAGAIDEAEAIRRIKLTHPTDFLVTGPTGRMIIEEAVEAQIDRTVFEVSRRSQAGKLIGGTKQVTKQVANQVVESAKRVILKPLDDAVKRVDNAVRSGKPLSKAEVDQLKIDVPYFSEWNDAFNKALPVNATADQIANAALKADGVIDELIVPEADRIFALAKGSMEDSLQKVPTLKMFGKEVARFPNTGERVVNLSSKFAASPIGENVQKLFSYTSNFPGYSTLIAQKTKALGVARYEARRKEIIKVARDLSRGEARQLQYNLENGIVGTGKMAVAYNFVKKSYDDLLGEEMSRGVRDANKATKAQNYAYVHIKRKSKTKKTIDEWNTNRSASVKASGKLDGYTSADAMAAGFKIERDAFKNLLYRNMRANRKLTQADFYRDLVTHYGFKGRVTDIDKKTRDLVPVEASKSNDILQAMKMNLEPGEKLYMDKEIKQIFDNYVAIAKSPDEIVRGLDYITRKFKIMNTIYFPGYHVRNIIGDYFMGLMDGVKTRDYAAIMNKWAKRHQTNITIGGQSVKMDKFLEIYETNLNSGAFLSGEVGNELFSGKLNPARGVRKVSESREDFGRIVHFYRAMDDEYAALLKKGVQKDKAWDEALNAAIFRVNKFKFDYSALTAGEMKYMRRGIPFYTYMRKAIPTLVESIILNPKYLSTMARLTENAEERYDDTLLPDWMRELGYGKLTDTFGMSFNMLPTNVVKEMFANPVSKFNPIIQGLFESNSGEDSFTHRPLDNTGLAAVPQIIANKWRGTTNLRDIAPTLDAATGIKMPETFFGKDNIGLDSDKTTTEKWANFFGFPIKRVGEQEKEQALNEIRYKLNGTLDEINATVSELGYKVYFSDRNDGQSLRVRDETTGEVIFEAANLKELREFVAAKRNEGKSN